MLVGIRRSGLIAHDGNRAPRPPYVLNKNSPSAKGVFAWWPGGGNPAKLQDFGPQQQFHGTLTNGPTFVRSSLGQTGFNYVASGGPDFINVGVLPGFLSQALGGVWFSVWIDNFTATTGPKAVFGTSDASNANRIFLFLNTGGDSGYISAQISDVNGDSTYWGIESNTGINDGNLHHLVVSFDPPTDVVRFWLDGVELSPTDLNLGADAASFVDFTEPVSIGCLNNIGSPAFGIDADIYDLVFGLGQLSETQALSFFNPNTRWDLYQEIGQQVFAFPATSSPAQIISRRPSTLVYDKLKKPEPWF